jgi:hypothetical protein
MNALEATDEQILNLLREAAAVTRDRDTPEQFKKWLVYGAAGASCGDPRRFLKQTFERLGAVYDAHATELQAIPLVEDSEQWTETQRWIRR